MNSEINFNLILIKSRNVKIGLEYHIEISEDEIYQEVVNINTLYQQNGSYLHIVQN